MIKTAQLRVYLPVDRAGHELFPPACGAEFRTAAGPYGILGEPMTEDALEAEWKGRRFVCPRTPLLRVLEGVLAIRQAYRRLGSATIIPEDVAGAARRELADLRQADPEIRSHILSSAWHVPLRWLVAFDPLAKEVVGADGTTTVRYRVAHGEADERLQKARSILSGSETFEPLSGEIRELERWLAGFPADAMVELDYGGVSTMFSEVDLIMDDSVGDVWAALEAIARGDVLAAAELRDRLVARWAAPVAVGYSS